MRNEWLFPTIGDNVFIGVGARILGDITVGDNAKIGANAVVLHDIPAHATAVGIPARVIKLDGEELSADPVAKTVHRCRSQEGHPAAYFVVNHP